MLDEAERPNWRDHVVPKLAACRGREKVKEPRWVPRLVELDRSYRMAR